MTDYNETPWWVEVDGEETWIEGQAHTVCEGVSNEDAERIVHCVNNHERLVDALREVTENLEHARFMVPDDEVSSMLFDSTREARTLLAQLQADKGGE